MASLTRNDVKDAKTVKAPLFGEIAIDGSLVVLIPAIVIGVAGFIMSADIALNSQDAIVQSLSQISDDVTAAAIAKTNSAAPLDGGCRGICSAPETDFENLKSFMQSLSK